MNVDTGELIADPSNYYHKELGRETHVKTVATGYEKQITVQLKIYKEHEKQLELF